MQAEVQRRLLNHTVGQVGPKSVHDATGEVDEVGVGPDLGEIGCRPRRDGAASCAYRRRKQVTQIDRINVRNRDVRSIAKSPLSQQDGCGNQGVEAELIGEAELDQVGCLLFGQPDPGRRNGCDP